MTDEDKELLWAKLGGDWNDANYRHQLAADGKCLRVLARDENRAVQFLAHQKFVDILFARSRIRRRE